MSEKMKYKLWYRKAEETLQEFDISGEVLIGSGVGCALKIVSEQASPEHARLTIKDEGIYITDLNSKHGTYLDGKRLTAQQPTRFTPGQTITIGGYTFNLVEEEAKSEPLKEQIHPVAPEPKEVAPPEKPPRITPLGGIFHWFASNARWLGIVIWIAVVIIGLATYFIISGKSKAAAMLTATPAPALTLQATVAPPTPTPEFVAPSLPTAMPVSTIVSVIPPGEGEILIEPITLLSQNINLNTLLSNGLNFGQLLELSTNIVGEKIGFAYQFVSIKYGQHITTIEKNYISAETTREIDGVSYPDWGTGKIPIKFEWKPGVNFINDGTKSEIALFYPTEYGVEDEYSKYAVDGWFTFSESGERRKARVFFDNQRNMLYVLGYKTNEQGIEAPYEIKPQAGDQFTILLEEFQFEESPTTQPTQTIPDITNLPFGGAISGLVGDKIPYSYGKGTFVQFEGGTLTFGDRGLVWIVDENYGGDFYVGFAAEDLDGNYYAGYVPVLVNPQ
jgi:hypothetical protein